MKQKQDHAIMKQDYVLNCPPPMGLQHNAALNQCEYEEQGSMIVEDASYHSHPNLKDNASLTRCEHEEPGSATVEPVNDPEHDAALNSCEDELYVRGRLTALAKLYVRDENLQ